MFAVGAINRKAIVYSALTGEAQATFLAKSGINAIAFSGSGSDTRVLAGTFTSQVLMWRVEQRTPEPECEISFGGLEVKCLAVGARGSILAVGGAKAQVAETDYGGRRLVVRRTLNESDQPTLVEDWRHHAFLTNLDGDVLEVDRTHRAHAVVELAIRDLKHDAGMIHMPSGIFQANAAWALACTLAHNLTRWTQLLTAAGSGEQVGPAGARSLIRR